MKIRQLTAVEATVTVSALLFFSIVAPAWGQGTVKQYAVKFVCGEADGQILAQGIYTTAINIQNRNQSDDVDAIKFRKRYSIALPNEQSGGVTNFLDGAELAAGEAVEIDCPDILENARGMCDGPFCKGFANIESTDELEIVAVYSAADSGTGQVASIHTERVTSAGRCPVTTENIEAQSILFVPPHVRGDREFDGHGPCVRFDLDLRVQDGGSALVANYYMHAYECSDDFNSPKSDHTAAEGRHEVVLLAAGPQSRILGHNLDNNMTETYIDTDHSDDVFNYGGTEPAQSLIFRGDTGGSEAGTKTRVFINTRPMRVTLENCRSDQLVID